MKHYELTYLISPDLSEEEANSLSTEITSSVQKKQGILEKNLSLLKKQLSHAIKKKTAAYLASLDFQINPEGLEELKKQIKSDPRILRHLILLKPIPKITEKKATKLSIISKKKAAGKKVELKEIEKKLEEILKNE